MNDPELYLLLADAVLIVHFSIVAFIVFGFLAILSGKLLGWNWIRYRVFRGVHLLAIGIVVLQAWVGRICPLTTWESVLREKAGQPGYARTFIQHWLHKVLFYDVEPWIFATLYTVFGLLVLASWLHDRSGNGGA